MISTVIYLALYHRSFLRAAIFSKEKDINVPDGKYRSVNCNQNLDTRNEQPTSKLISSSKNMDIKFLITSMIIDIECSKKYSKIILTRMTFETLKNTTYLAPPGTPVTRVLVYTVYTHVRCSYIYILNGGDNGGVKLKIAGFATSRPVKLFLV